MPGQSQPGTKRGSSCSKMHVAGVTVELVLTAVGTLLVVLGAILFNQWEPQIDARFQKEMVLSPSSQGVSEWTSPSIILSSRIYFWNWTNPNDVGTRGYKPVFEEVGPYFFREEHHKVNLTWSENGTVSFKWQKFFYFDPDQSGGQLTDLITSVNTVAATLSAMTDGLPFMAKRALSLGLSAGNRKIYWTHTVSELTFEGFDEPVLKLGSYLSSSAPSKFGYFYERNGTIPSDVYTMATGATGINSLGDIKSFNYESTTPAHTGECSLLRGSLGELMHPHFTPQSTLVIYAPDMCRPISYYYIGESSHNGIPTLVFASTLKSVDNGSLVPENECFCPDSGCEPSGLFDLRSCRQGAPVMMSFPHLYLADSTYTDSIIGMNPNSEKHRFYVEIEPRTGIPMEVAARLQLNVKISKNKALKMFRNIEDVLVPVFWIETYASLPETHTADVKFLLNIISLGPFASSMVITIGTIILVIIILRQHCWNTRCKGHQKSSSKVKMAEMGQTDKSVSDSLIEKDGSTLQTKIEEHSLAAGATAVPLLTAPENNSEPLDDR